MIRAIARLTDKGSTLKRIVGEGTETVNESNLCDPKESLIEMSGAELDAVAGGGIVRVWQLYGCGARVARILCRGSVPRGIPEFLDIVSGDLSRRRGIFQNAVPRFS